MTSGHMRVVKVGGSLLELPDLSQRILCWLARQPAGPHVFVVGGGPFVDALRRLDQQRPVEAATAHWLAIDCMQVTAGLLHALLPDSELIRVWEDLVDPKRTDCSRMILDVKQFLRVVEPTLPGVRLPADWAVTSDSIAGRIAAALSADSLVLLKSRAPAEDNTVAMWAEERYVDGFFPQLLAELPSIEWINLRDNEWTAVAGGKGK